MAVSYPQGEQLYNIRLAAWVKGQAAKGAEMEICARFFKTLLVRQDVAVPRPKMFPGAQL
ncbi:MAG: hypothetical protein ACOX1I_08695 [Dethiobacteria bacterium]|jgi:hypothetical protein